MSPSVRIDPDPSVPRRGEDEPHYGIAVRPGNDGSALMTVDGEFDLAAYEPFMQALARIAAQQTALTIETARVHYIDSTGLRCLLQARNLLGEERVRLVRPSEAVTKLLAATGTRHLFQVDGPAPAQSA